MGRTIAPLERVGTKRAKFLATESENSLRISAPQCWPFKKREMGSVKGETKSANIWQGKVCKLIAKCEFLARESVNSSPILARQLWRHFRLSLSLSLSFSFSLSVSLSLSLSPSAPHAQYRKRFRASYNSITVHTRTKIPRQVCLLFLRVQDSVCNVCLIVHVQSL